MSADARATEANPMIDGAAVSAQRPLNNTNTQENPCAIQRTFTALSPFSARGLPRGPAVRELRITHEGTWLAATSDALCESRDDGQTWRKIAILSPVLDSTEGTREQWSLQELGVDHRWLFVHSKLDGAQPSLLLDAWISQADESWTELALPCAKDTIRSLTTDGLGRVLVQTTNRLHVAEYRKHHESGWTQSFALPGRDALVLHACGRVLLTRTQIDDDGTFWFRSFDHGAHWSPFLLTQLGLDADHATVRCLGARGAIEAGRGALPTHWSFDGGRNWTHAVYDERARRLARENGPYAVRCQAGPTNAIECRDDARTRLIQGSRPDREIYAPGWCDSVTQMDSRRTVSFGPRCGMLVSTDHGGLWRPLFSAAEPAEPFAVDGQGGLLAGRTAWRLDGGIWWTHDDGAHWTPVASVIGRTLTRGVFVDDNRGVFSTRNGWVVSTHDGGRTWVYVIRGDVERISSEGPMVFVTTTSTVRVSPDGGEHWWSPGVGATGARVLPTVQRQGSSLVVQLANNHRIEQSNQEIRWIQPGHSAAPVLQLLLPHVSLTAASMNADGAPRVLLSDGSIASGVAAANPPTAGHATSTRRSRRTRTRSTSRR